MTEEIIIDCAFYKDGVCASPINKTCEYCKNINVSKCYHKQLKRLEQERDELKKTIENQKLEYEELQCDLSEVENACGCYQSENAELKQENKELIEDNLNLSKENKELKEEIQFHNKENSNLLAERNAAQIGYDEIRKVRERYRSALEEIREKLNYWESYFCDNCPFQNKNACDKNEKGIGENTCMSVQLIKMQDKINEVLS